MKNPLHAKHHINPWQIWMVAVSFLLFQFFLQLSSGVVLNKIMTDMQYSALVTGTIGSAFYYVYTGLQIPVGLLFDRFGARNLLAVNAFICAAGCFLFAFSSFYSGLFMGRLLMGGGSAFAFVGLAHILRVYFPLRQFAFMISVSDTLGFLITVLGMIIMGFLIAQWGWRGFMAGAGIAGVIIAYLCWQFIPEEHNPLRQNNSVSKILPVLANPLTWVNGIFSGLGFTVITVFGSLWAVPFMQIKLRCSLFEASVAASMIFLGAAAGLPLFGKLYVALAKRKPLMHFSCLSTAFLMILIIFIPTNNLLLTMVIMLIIGLSCGGYILAFAIANELAPKDALSTCTGFTNMLAMITAPLMQPLIGYVLDKLNKQQQLSSLAAFQLALLIIPFSLVIASILVSYLPEKNE